MAQRRLSLIEDRHAQVETSALATIIRSYRNLIIRLYCHIRFRIIPLRFLEEMVQYIPRRGTVLDLGCGFGLFTLYYAKSCPDVHFTGIDLSRRRIQAAKRSARKLNLTNVSFVCQDAREYTRESGQRFDAVMTLDLLHHIPVPDGDRLLEFVYREILNDHGVLILKDVNTRPRAMIYFTYLLDLLMNPKDCFWYRSVDTWLEKLRSIGFGGLEKHFLWDTLPYPHVLIVARKGQDSGSIPCSAEEVKPQVAYVHEASTPELAVSVETREPTRG